MPIETTPLYWDCECEHGFIHSHKQVKCDICGARRDEQPDSRINEVIAAGLPL